MGAYVKHTATVSGSRWKAVTCHWCATEFTYLRSAQASASKTTGWYNFWKDNGARAADSARVNLDRELDESSPIRCPTCDKFQPTMYRAIRHQWAAQHTWKPIAAAVVLIAIAGFLGRRDAFTLSPGDFIERYLENIFNLDMWLALIAALVVVGVIAIHVAARTLDPNLDRDRWSVARGTPRAELETTLGADTAARLAPMPSPLPVPMAMAMPASPPRHPSAPD